MKVNYQLDLNSQLFWEGVSIHLLVLVFSAIFFVRDHAGKFIFPGNREKNQGLHAIRTLDWAKQFRINFTG